MEIPNVSKSWTRRRLIGIAKALRDQGTVPPGVDNPEVYRQRSGEMVLPRNVDWWEEYRKLREQFNAQALPAEARAATV